MRPLIAIAALAVLGGCVSFDDVWPDGPADRADRTDAKRTVERTCPQGEVIMRPGTDGKSQGDYYCKHKRRKD